MDKYCCKKMETVLTAGRKVDRQIEVDKDGNLYIYTAANDTRPYHEEKIMLKFCPFCGTTLGRYKFLAYLSNKKAIRKLYEAD